jgi:uncharacterized protein YbaR (Trm112 family)
MNELTDHALLQTDARSLSLGADLLGLLCCPETRQSLVLAPPEMVVRLETLRAAGTLRNRGGKVVAESIREGLLRADGAVFYPVSDGIPLLVLEEGVMVPQI